MRSPVKRENMLALAEYQRRLYKEPRLRFLFFELTDRCNLNCRHCGSRCTAQNHTVLPLAEVVKVLRQVSRRYDPGSIMVCLTGGEPLLHPELIRIIYMAHGLGFIVGITTNGTLIDRVTAEHLVQAGIDAVTVSIDGIGAVHDELRRSDGCYEKARQAIRLVREAGLEPEAMTVVHKKNIDQLEALYQTLKKEELSFWRLTNVDPIGRAEMDAELLLDGGDLRQLYEFIREKRFQRQSDLDMEVSYGCAHFLGPDYEREVRDFYFQCGAGLSVASIMANGNIGACLDIERRDDLVQGNIYEDDFVDVWENRFEVFRRDRTSASHRCGSCIHKDICMGDSAHTWDYDRNEPRYCVWELIQEVS